jgi:hypothetical protein
MADQQYNQRMSNAPPPRSHLQPPWASAAPAAHLRPAGWPAFAALAIALIATGVAIGAWVRPLPDNKPSSPPAAHNFSAQQVADAKSKICAAFAKVDSAVRAASGRNKGEDYATQFATAINVRQALVAGSQYLSMTLNRQPAAPADLASGVRDLVNAYQLLAIELLSDAPEPEKDPTVHAGDDANSKIENLCK